MRVTRHGAAKAPSICEPAEGETEHVGQREAQILNAISEGICGVDGDGRIVFANRAAADLLNDDPAAMIGRSFHESYQGAVEADAPAPSGTQPVFQGRDSRMRTEVTLHRRTGERFLAEVSLAPAPLGGGSGPACVIAFRDITEIRRNDDLLRKLSFAVEQSPTAIVITGLDGTIEYINDAFEHVTGYTSAEVIGRNPRLLSSGQTPKRVIQQLWETITAGGQWSGELLNRRKDGSLFWEKTTISPLKGPDGVTANYLAIKQDITRRKEIELQIKQSLGFQRACNRLLRISQSPTAISKKFENMLDIVSTMDWIKVLPRAVLYLHDPENGTFRWFHAYDLHDEAPLRIATIDPAASAFAGMLATGAVTYSAPSADDDNGYWADAEPQAHYEVPLMVDGSAIGLLAISVPADHTPGGHHRDFIKAMADILAMTIERDRKAAEILHHRDHLQTLVDAATAELRDQARELALALEKEKELNRLQRQFVSMASHEFRTPLAIIDSTAQRIGRRFGRGMTTEDLERRIERIRSAVARMTGLIESTLSAARHDTGKVKISPADCAIGDLITDVCARQQEMSPNHVIVADLDWLPSTIVADRDAIDRIFTNLLSNAVKYSPAGGLIYVVGDTEGDRISVSVRDHGLGIPADELPHMCERFFRARTSTGIAGTGIGLYLVKQLLDMHCGSIEVSSIVREGSTFVVCLPIDPEFEAEDLAVAEERIAVKGTSAPPILEFGE